jgi:hypothetical protein
MKIVLDSPEALGRDIWEVQLRPVDAQRLTGNPLRLSGRTIVTADALHFDGDKRSLEARVEDLRVLAIGDLDKAIVVLDRSESKTKETGEKDLEARMSQGDREFLSEISCLPEEAGAAARELLSLVRQREPGWMKRGDRRNFSNQPDNFWYAVVQPRRGNVSITVRGRPADFGVSKLELKDDRPGYSRFYLSQPSDVQEAFRIVSRSRRRQNS